MFAKVCGLTTFEQIDLAIALGYDAIGVVTYPKSKRYVEPTRAIELANHAKGRVKTFVVGLSYADVAEAAHAFDYIQIYEAKDLPNLVLAAKDKPPAGTHYEYFVYDASVGSGVFQEFPDWLRTVSTKLILAGGLNAENVGAAIAKFHPFGVDVSSGVEKDGVKDAILMQRFIEAVRQTG